MITTQSPTGSQWSTPTLAREITSSDTMDENESGEADWDYSHAAAPVVPGLGQESHTMGRLQIFLEAAELASYHSSTTTAVLFPAVSWHRTYHLAPTLHSLVMRWSQY